MGQQAYDSKGRGGIARDVGGGGGEILGRSSLYGPNHLLIYYATILTGAPLEFVHYA